MIITGLVVARLQCFSLSMATLLTWAFVLPASWNFPGRSKPHCPVGRYVHTWDNQDFILGAAIMSVCGKFKDSRQFITNDKIVLLVLRQVEHLPGSTQNDSQNRCGDWNASSIWWFFCGGLGGDHCYLRRSFTLKSQFTKDQQSIAMPRCSSEAAHEKRTKTHCI